MSGRNCFIKGHTLFEEKKPSFLASTKKRNLNVPNVSGRKDTGTGLQDSVGIDALFLHPHFIKMRIWNETKNHIPN